MRRPIKELAACIDEQASSLRAMRHFPQSTAGQPLTGCELAWTRRKPPLNVVVDVASAPNSTVGNRPTSITSANAYIVAWAKVPYKLDGVYFHACRIARRRRYTHLRMRRLCCRAHGAERYSGNLFQRETVYRVNYEWHAIQDDLHPDGKMTREPCGCGRAALFRRRLRSL